MHFLIVKVVIFNFPRKLLNGFENIIKRKDRGFQTLDRWCTPDLNLIVASF